MSQIRQRRNVTELVAVNFEQAINVTTAASVVGNAISNVTDTVIRELITDNVDFSSTTISSSMPNTIQSPIVLRNKFAESYTKAMTEITQEMDLVTKQKMAVIKTLSICGHKIQSSKTLETGVQEVMKAMTSEALSTTVEKIMNTVQSEHNTIFMNSIASVVQRASIAIGFSDVKIQQVAGIKSVVALNEQGQSIVTDVKVDEKTQRVDLVSETIGINDKSCNIILNKFDKELEKAGLKHRKPDVKWKKGVEWLPDGNVRSSPKSQVKSNHQDNFKKLHNMKIKHS